MTLQFLRPIKSDKCTQTFGENDTCAKCMPSGFPYRPFIIINKIGTTCPPGSKDFYRLLGMKGHNGGDWAAWHLEPVYHCGLYKGFMQTSHDRDGGLNVDVVSLEPLVACTEGCPAGTMHYILTRYAHGGKAVGFEKKPINPGDNIMLADNTGDSSGDHVHWSPKWCDATGKELHLDNGYNGAFNYAPWFQNIFILDFIAQQKAHADEAAHGDDLVHPSIADIPVPTPAPITTSQWLSKALFAVSLFFSRLSPRK